MYSTGSKFLAHFTWSNQSNFSSCRRGQRSGCPSLPEDTFVVGGGGYLLQYCDNICVCRPQHCRQPKFPLLTYVLEPLVSALCKCLQHVSGCTPLPIRPPTLCLVGPGIMLSKTVFCNRVISASIGGQLPSPLRIVRMESQTTLMPRPVHWRKCSVT